MSNKVDTTDMKHETKQELKPKLRFPEFRDAPEWKKTKLKRLAKRITLKNTEGKETRVLTNSAEYGIVDQKDYFDKDIANKDNLNGYLIVDRGDYVYNPRISTIAPVGPISTNNIGKGVMSPLYTVFRFENSNNAFYAYYFKSTQWHQYLRQVSNSGARHDRMSITNDDFMDMPLPAPHLEEQQKIADCLTSIDELIAEQTQKLDTLKAHKNGLMQQLFPAEGETVPRLRFPEFRDAPEWEERRLGDVCQKIMDGTHFSPQSKSGTHMYLTSKNIQNGTIDLSNVSNISEEEHRQIYEKCPVKKNDVLLTKDGANTGNCAINNIDVEFSLLSSVAVLRGNPLLLEQKFLYQVILFNRTQRLIQESMAGQAITRITLEKIGNFLIAITTIEEQQKIADCLSSIDEQIAAQTQKIAMLKAHKKGLMQQLFPSPDEVGDE
jgi:type I restriction enzyme S subunit